MARYGYGYGNGVMPKLVGAAAIGALVLVMVKDPVDAATWLRLAGRLLLDLIDGIGQFLRATTNH